MSTPPRLKRQREACLAGAADRLIRFDELTDDEHDFFSRAVFSRQRRMMAGQREADLGRWLTDRWYYVAFLEEAEEWGIMCPHPLHEREYFERWFTCRCCGYPVVIARAPGGERDAATDA